MVIIYPRHNELPELEHGSMYMILINSTFQCSKTGYFAKESLLAPCLLLLLLLDVLITVYYCSYLQFLIKR